MRDPIGFAYCNIALASGDSMGRNIWIKAATGLTGVSLSVAHTPTATAACNGLCSSDAVRLAAQGGTAPELVWASAALGICSIAAVSALVLRKPSPARVLAADGATGAGTWPMGNDALRTARTAQQRKPAIVVKAAETAATGLTAQTGFASDTAAIAHGDGHPSSGGHGLAAAPEDSSHVASRSVGPMQTAPNQLHTGSWLYGNITPEIAAKIEAFHKEQEARQGQPVQGRGSNIKDVIAPLDVSTLDASTGPEMRIEVREALQASLAVAPTERLAHWQRAGNAQAHSAQIIQFPRARRAAEAAHARLREASSDFAPRPVEWKRVDIEAPTRLAADWFEPTPLQLAAV